jgi:adenosine deaminase
MSADLLTPLWHPESALPHLDPGGWERLLRQARLAALVPRVAMHFDRLGGLDRVPAGPRQHLENGLRLAERQVQAVRWEVERIRRAVAPTGTPVVLLKGAAYLLAGLPAAQGRLFADIDILVPRDRLEIVELALLGAGWVSRERDRYNQRYYRVWMHELPPLEHVKRSTVIDVHHTITPPTSSFNVDGQLLLAQSRTLPGHQGLAVLQPVDMLLHSMVHLFQEGDFDHGLRDLIDMHALLAHFAAQDPGFWPQLTARAPASPAAPDARRMPKAETARCTSKACLEPELIFALMQPRNGVALPYPERRRAACGLRLHRPAELPGHLLRRRVGAADRAGLLRHGLGLLRARRGRQRGARGSLLRPADAHRPRRADRAVIVGLAHACRRAHAEFGISAKLILCFLRHLSEEAAFATLEQALPWRHHFIGVGLDSSERGHPPEKFARVFARAASWACTSWRTPARKARRPTSRARSTCCEVERIDHGVRCTERPGTGAAAGARARAADGVPAVERQAVRLPDAGRAQPAALLDAGLCVTINSDDPAYFGGYVNQNYLETFAALPQLTARHAHQLAANSFEASFAPAELKARWRRELDAVFDRLSA